MLVETGHYALWLAGAMAFLQALLPTFCADRRTACALAVSAAKTQSALLTFSIAALGYGFIANDFAVRYIAAHSNSLLPWYYRLTAVWGGHEGSLLLWIEILGLWSAALAVRSKALPDDLRAKILAVLGAISLGFITFIGFTSNPFSRALPAPFDGADLNPLLQDPGLILHPPLLYTGYVGFAVAFAFVVAGLWQGRLDTLWLRRARPWTLAAWLALTLGIALGSYWAYYELGWGGWWFWDPVENASLMPWLLGLALLHSLMATEKQGVFSYWTTLFSLLAFAFSVLGTFIVRSGALTSVHAFSLDNTRGYVLLLIFFVLTVLAFGLFALRADSSSESAVKFQFVSKSGGILLLNILLTIATVSTFLGTFYPMLFQAMNWGSISVGSPYFNSIFFPIITVILILMVISLTIRWVQFDRTLLIRCVWLLIPSLILAGLMIWQQLRNNSALNFHAFAFVLLTLAIWLLFVTLWQNWRQIRLSQFGMILAHCGVAIVTIGAVMSGYFGSEIGVRLAPQQSQTLGQYEFHYRQFSNEIGSNFTAEVAFFDVTENGKPYAEIIPERRYYDVRTMTMSEVGLDGGFWGDLYIVMGDSLGKGEFTFRLHYKPLIRWLWAGGILMAFGALCSVFGLRRKQEK